MLETLGLQGACDEALRTARELEPQVGTLVGENEGFGRCSASWSASRTWRDRSSRPGSATLTLFRQILGRIGKLAWYATTPSGHTRFYRAPWTCPDFVDTWVKLLMLRDPTVARRPGG